MANELSMDTLKRLARLGARARLEEIEAERKSILRAFPGLTPAPARLTATNAPAGQPAAEKRKTCGRRRRRKMTAAEKKVVSERMKKYWAARKAGGEQK